MKTFNLYTALWILYHGITPLQAAPPSSLDLYEKGVNVLQPLLTYSSLKVSAEEEFEYIINFPFENYFISEVPLQGSFYVDDIDDGIKQLLKSHGLWEPLNWNLIKKYVLPSTTAIDIGAHIGTHTIVMSQCVGKEGSVFAFDPNKKIFRELCYNLALNQCENTFPINCALGKSAGYIQVVSADCNNEGAAYVIPGYNEQDVSTILPLDDFCLTNVSFIKIDVENVEDEVIEGALETIKRNRPIILIEIQGNHVRARHLGDNLEEKRTQVMQKLFSLGYELYSFESRNDFLALPN